MLIVLQEDAVIIMRSS